MTAVELYGLLRLAMVEALIAGLMLILLRWGRP